MKMLHFHFLHPKSSISVSHLSCLAPHLTELLLPKSTTTWSTFLHLHEAVLPGLKAIREHLAQ